jgi:hypothetical protein
VRPRAEACRFSAGTAYLPRPHWPSPPFNTNGAGYILCFDGTAWGVADSDLPGANLFGLARDGYSRTWRCTDDKVWVSLDDGFSWKDASRGLPKRPHCAELRYNFAQQNSPLLYLSTYGRSVWCTSAINL